MVVFANTGKEDEGTLNFVRECGQQWGIPIVWLEYWPASKKGYAVRAEVVTFETASRKGEPFERLITCLGVPCSAAPFCSTLLKRDTIRAYMRQIGWKGYDTAIGIRSDELDRVSANYKRDRVIYPFISSSDWPHIRQVKTDIMEFWRAQSFDLNIHPDAGNCDNCWKKNFDVLARNAKRAPETFDWWDSMSAKANAENPRNVSGPQSFYRTGLTVEDIKFMADHLTADQLKELAESMKLNGCGESCEAF